MRVLYISLLPLQSNSSAMLGNIALIKGLAENGCKVKVIVSKVQKHSTFHGNNRFSYPNVEVLEIGDDSDFSIIKKSKSSNLSIKTLLKIYKTLSLFGSGKVLLKYAKTIKFEEDFDIVISASDPKASHLFASTMLEKVNFKHWVQLWGDPLMIDITSTSRLPKFYKWLVEYKILKKATKVMYVSPLTLNQQKKMFKRISDKMFFLPLPYQREVYYTEPSNQLPLVGYFGNYNTIARDITPLYDAFKYETSMELIIAGDSELKLEKRENIQIFQRISKEKVDEFERQCDILICLANKKGTQIPAKANYYSATNKPILFILDGDESNLKSYLSNYNRFVFARNNIEDILKQLRWILSSDQRWFPVKELSSHYIAERLISELNIKET